MADIVTKETTTVVGEGKTQGAQTVAGGRKGGFVANSRIYGLFPLRANGSVSRLPLNLQTDGSKSRKWFCKFCLFSYPIVHIAVCGNFFFSYQSGS